MALTSRDPRIDGSEETQTDWGSIDLPDAWPDIALRRGLLRGLALVVPAVFQRRRPVEFPAGLPGAERLPAYLRQEFHHLPNGFYSKNLTEGYARCFDLAMLGHMDRARSRVAGALAGHSIVADIGSGSGGLAAVLVAAGVPEVWGVEPSPYMLQIAARRLRGVRFVQGLAECTGFADHQLDGVGLTYVLHELPPRALDAALAEIRRILRPGGRVAFAEPSPLHYIGDWRTTLRSGGLRALYYRALAKIAYEPFVAQWHRRDVSRDLAEAGFRVVVHDDMIPTRIVVAERD